MSNDLELYHRILFIERPWLDTATTDAKYQQLLYELSMENFAQQPLYELSFPKPLTPKRKFYSAIIANEAIRFLNSIHTLMNSGLIENEKKYHIHKTLSKRLPALLHETEKIITSQKLYFAHIEDPAFDKKIKEDAYVIQYLKYRLIALFLEIQKRFADYLKEEILSDGEVSSIYFSEVYNNSLIKPAPNVYSFPKQITKTPIKKNKFSSKKGDFRTAMKGIMLYEDIISDAQSFANVEEVLFDVNLIDEEYNFTSVHTEKQKLAAIYHVLIRKGYFKKRNFIKKKPITDVDIRKFLDRRYNTNLDSQFRHWRRNPDGLASFIKPFAWIDNLPHC